MLKDKAELRSAMKRLRADALDRLERNRKIFEKFFTLDEVAHGQNFFMYASFGDEVNTWEIMNELFARGKDIFLPRVEGDQIVFSQYTGQELRRSSYGIFEPIEPKSDKPPDVIVLPLLAADRNLYRLGYGGGYYDRYLAQHRGGLKIGIAFDFQLVENVFAQTHDIAVDVLVTDRTVMFADKRRNYGKIY